MKRGNKQALFFVMMFTLTALSIFILQFEITGNVITGNVVIGNNWCDGSDINQDGTVNATDQKYILDYWGREISSCYNLNPPTSDFCLNADIDNDGDIGLGDITLFSPETWTGTTCAAGNPPTSLCGTSDGKTLTTKPSSTNLCGSNLKSSVTTTTTGWTWTCTHPSYVTSSSCTATKANACTSNTGYICTDFSGNSNQDCDSEGKTYVANTSLDIACGASKICCKPKCVREGESFSSSVSERVNQECCEGLTSYLPENSPTGTMATCELITGAGCGTVALNDRDTCCQNSGDDYWDANTADCEISLCGPAHSTTRPLAPTNNILCDGNNKSSLVTITSTGWKWTCTNPINVISNCTATKGEDTNNIPLSKSQLENGRTLILYPRNTVKFKIGTKSHTLKVYNLTAITAGVIINSNPIKTILNEEQTRKFEMTGDHYYDLQVKLIRVSTASARVTIKAIHDKKDSATQSKQYRNEGDAKNDYKKETGDDSEEVNRLWIYIIIGLVALILFVTLLIFLAHKRRQRYEY